MPPIPGLDLEVAALAVHHALEHFALLAGLGHGRRPYFVEQAANGFRRLGHGVFEAELGERREAEELCALGSERQDLRRNCAVVVRAPAFAAFDPCGKGNLAQVASCREFQEAFDARSRERDDVLAGMSEVVGRTLGRSMHEIRKPRQIGLVFENELVALFVGQNILREGRAERRETRIDLRHALLGFGGEAGAGPHEARMRALEDAALFGIELLAQAALDDRFDAGEETRIERNGRAVLREDRRDIALDSLQFGVRIGAGEIVKYAKDAREHRARLLHGRDRIGERRRSTVRKNLLDLGLVCLDGLVNGWAEVRRLDLLEGRQLERRLPGAEQRIACSCRAVGLRFSVAHAGLPSVFGALMPATR